MSVLLERIQVIKRDWSSAKFPIGDLVRTTLWIRSFSKSDTTFSSNDKYTNTEILIIQLQIFECISNSSKQLSEK